jgi:hypothetical protein
LAMRKGNLEMLSGYMNKEPRTTESSVRSSGISKS